jgi:hypothetical protein
VGRGRLCDGRGSGNALLGTGGEDILITRFITPMLVGSALVTSLALLTKTANRGTGAVLGMFALLTIGAWISDMVVGS